MLEVRAIRRTDHHLSIKQVLAKVAAVELVAEFLQDLKFHAMVHVGKQRLALLMAICTLFISPFPKFATVCSIVGKILDKQKTSSFFYRTAKVIIMIDACK